MRKKTMFKLSQQNLRFVIFSKWCLINSNKVEVYKRGFLLLDLYIRITKQMQFKSRGTVCPIASGSRGPHQLISRFLFIASLDEFKGSPNRSSLQGSKSASRFSSPRFPYFLPFLLTLITNTRGLTLQFCPWVLKTSRWPCLGLEYSCIV